MTQNPSQSDPAPDDNPLEHIVDDLEPVLRCRTWAAQELLKGRVVEDLVAELVSEGWDPDAAAEQVDYAVRETRRQRGVVTREDVIREANARYRQSWGIGWLSGFPVWAAFRRLLLSLSFLRKSKPKNDDR